MTKARIFFFLLLAFVAGVGVRSFFIVPYEILFAFFLLAGTMIAFGAIRGRPRAVVFGVLLVSSIFGVVRYDWHENARPDLSNLYGKSFQMEGAVAREPSRGEKSQLFVFRVYALDGGTLDPPFDIRVTTRRFPEYMVGDRLALTGVIEKPERIENFDYPAYLKKDGIEAVASFPVIDQKEGRSGNMVRLYLADIKRAFEENIVRVLPEPHGAFLKGLLLGDRESLPKELVESFRRTGVTHLVALSGYNITLVGMFFMTCLLFLTVRFYTAFWIAAAGIIAFVIMTGASPSGTRAGIMGGLLLIAEREGRIYQMRNALALAAAVMIFINPAILRFDAAFELSFLAVLGLMFFSPRIEAYCESLARRVRGTFFGKTLRPRGRRNIIFHTLAETLGAQIAVLPLIIYLFGQVSLISPISNVLVILAVPYAMAFGFFMGLLGFAADWLAWLPGIVAWALLEYMIRMVEFFARVPFASISVHSRFAAVLAASITVFAVAFTIRHRVLRKPSV